MLHLKTETVEGGQGLVFPYILPTGYHQSVSAILREITAKTKTDTMIIKTVVTYDTSKPTWKKLELPLKTLGKYRLYEIVSSIRTHFEAQEMFYAKHFDRPPSLATKNVTGVTDTQKIELTLPPGFIFASKNFNLLRLLAFKIEEEGEEEEEDEEANSLEFARFTISGGFFSLDKELGEWHGLLNKSLETLKLVASHVVSEKPLSGNSTQDDDDKNFADEGPLEFVFGRFNSPFSLLVDVPYTSVSDDYQFLLELLRQKVLKKLLKKTLFSRKWIELEFKKSNSSSDEGFLKIVKQKTPFSLRMSLNRHAQICMRLSKDVFSFGKEPRQIVTENWDKNRLILPADCFVISSTHQPFDLSFITDRGVVNILGELDGRGRLKRPHPFSMNTFQPNLQLSLIDKNHSPITFDNAYEISLILDYSVSL